ncbi:MAG: zinc-dependent peptidase [Saprospiraceae bacterium]|nr:zinc-dependent peptidase [Saprospiraceae bacterium]MDW8483169.1 zinc-dependent peptidase [Saprospiraceae bacterium]
MRQNFALLLLSPFVAGALVFLYLAWKDSTYAPAIIPFVVMAAVIWIFSPQINWWWYSRRPPKLPDELRTLLERGSIFYRTLSPAEKQRFQNRVALFMLGTDWMPLGWPEEQTLHLDIQLAIAVQAVTLTWNEPNFLFEKIEKVVVYPHPFPSPQYDYLHASEFYPQDGCVLFSAEQLMSSFLRPGTMYNIGMHECAKIFIHTYPEKPYPILEDSNIWERLEACSRMSRGHVESVVGIPNLEPLPVAIHHYFLFPSTFRAILPEVADALDAVFSPRSNA